MCKVHEVLCGQGTVKPWIFGSSCFIINYLLIIHITHSLFQPVYNTCKQRVAFAIARVLNRFYTSDKGVWIFRPHLLDKGQVTLTELLLCRISKCKIICSKIDCYYISLPIVEIPKAWTIAFPPVPVLTTGPFPWHHDAGCPIIQD